MVATKTWEQQAPVGPKPEPERDMDWASISDALYQQTAHIMDLAIYPKPAGMPTTWDYTYVGSRPHSGVIFFEPNVTLMSPTLLRVLGGRWASHWDGLYRVKLDGRYLFYDVGESDLLELLTVYLTKSIPATATERYLYKRNTGIVRWITTGCARILMGESEWVETLRRSWAVNSVVPS